MTARVLVLASELPPSLGVPAHGGGLRGWTLAEGLRSAGLDVRLRFPREAVQRAQDAGAALPDQDWDALTYPWNDPLASFEADRPDVVVVSSWLLAGHITGCPVPLVVDLAGPVLFEFLAQSADKALDLAHHKPRALASADFVTCAGQRQRHYFLAWLALSGFTPEDCARRLAVVPISCRPSGSVRAESSGEPRFVFAGLPLAWQDPVRALNALVTRLEERGRGHLDVYMGQHPIHSAGAAWFPWLEDRIARGERAALHPPMPYERLLEEYQRADVAFDIFEYGIERELAVSTRTIDYLWAGVVPMLPGYAELAGAVAEHDAGLVLEPPFDQSAREAVDLILDHPERLAAMSANARRLARSRFAWDRTIGPLAAFCRAPTRRVAGAMSPKALVGDLVAEAERHAAENVVLKAHTADLEREFAGLRDYTATVEREWATKGAELAVRESDLKSWRQHPWRGALTATAAAVSRRLRPGD